jgi:hypothetical protein
VITVEIILPSTRSATSAPLEATKDEILQAIDTDTWIDFPCDEPGASERFTLCLPTQFVRERCALVIREVKE